MTREKLKEIYGEPLVFVPSEVKGRIQPSILKEALIDFVIAVLIAYADMTSILYSFGFCLIAEYVLLLVPALLIVRCLFLAIKVSRAETICWDVYVKNIQKCRSVSIISPKKYIVDIEFENGAVIHDAYCCINVENAEKEEFRGWYCEKLTENPMHFWTHIFEKTN